MFHLLKIRTRIDIFRTEKCKATFGLKYISRRNLDSDWFRSWSLHTCYLYVKLMKKSALAHLV